MLFAIKFKKKRLPFVGRRFQYLYYKPNITFLYAQSVMVLVIVDVVKLFIKINYALMFIDQRKLLFPIIIINEPNLSFHFLNAKIF
jgi:hypothetical protein